MAAKVTLIRRLLSNKIPYITVAKDVFSIHDLLEIYRRRIGRGLIGSKAAELLLSNRILHNSEDADIRNAVGDIESIFIGADEFYILTDVPKVYINFRKENEQALDTITVAQAQQYLAEGQFAEGSMAPKVRAAILFVQNGGKECIITEAGELGNPSCGTRIVK